MVRQFAGRKGRPSPRQDAGIGIVERLKALENRNAPDEIEKQLQAMDRFAQRPRDFTGFDKPRIGAGIVG